MTDAEAVIQKGRGSYAVFEDVNEERAQRLRSPGERYVPVKGAKCPYDACIYTRGHVLVQPPGRVVVGYWALSLTGRTLSAIRPPCFVLT